MVAADMRSPKANYLLLRGEYDQRGDLVETAAPASIMASAADLPKNRLGLARWLTDPKNPLAARVVVNRYWQMLFGTGIVKTSEDFGTQGDQPSHEQLLDHLSREFVNSHWDVKKLLRKMVLSATYRQSSIRDATILRRDPANRLLSHGPRRRLQAEFLRDHVLAVSGLLVDRRGGPGVHPYQPAELFGRNAIGAAGANFKQSSGEGLYRRSLYTYWKTSNSGGKYSHSRRGWTDFLSHTPGDDQYAVAGARYVERSAICRSGPCTSRANHARGRKDAP